MENFRLLLIALLLITLNLDAQVSTEKYLWSHLSTEYGDLELPNDGKLQTDCILGDVTKDGKVDFIIVEKTSDPSVVMYSYIEGKKWNKTIIEKRKLLGGESGDLGDIDGDGDLDLAIASGESNQIWWWENPYPNSSDRPWKRNYIKKSGANVHSDIAFGDFNGDGVVELVFWNQGDNALYVAKRPADFDKNDDWPLTKIYSYSNDGQMMQQSKGTELANVAINYHEGICVEDINLDGIKDVVAGAMWFNFKNGVYHTNYIDLGYVGSRIAAGQLINGDRPEVVMVSGEAEGPVILYQYLNGVWTSKILDKTTRRCHSLQLIDFDKDGDIDVFLAEMKLPSVIDPKMFILLNKGQGNFDKLNIASNFDWHNSKVGDIDSDGDNDIIGKPYGWDTPRVDIWLNNGKK